jgi:hypothetical protein
MFSPIAALPDAWKTDITVLRGGGRDEWNNVLPVEEIPVTDCVVGGSSSNENVPRSELADSTANLYRGPGFRFYSDDRIKVPEGALMAGEYSVEGVPHEWPMGTHVALRRV